MSWLDFLALMAFILAGRWLVSTPFQGRDAAFVCLNLWAVALLFSQSEDPHWVVFAAYLIIVSVQYVTVWLWAAGPGLLPWLAFATPITFLVVLRWIPADVVTGLGHPGAKPSELPIASLFVGFSYLSFRTSLLVLEVRNRLAPRPSFFEYLGFAFFAPTLLVGPISPFSQHRTAFLSTGRPEIPVSRALMRMVVGLVKFKFLGPIANQLAYSGLLLDGYYHPWIDLAVAAVAYYLYLYCNFSGFCDIAIGVSGLTGISVAENFNNPFAARNIKDFWNRWHLTLSHYMRDVVFSPLSKTLVRTLGPRNSNHAIALTILVVFLLVGIWHGRGWNYVAFGAAHALGVVVNHYYSIVLKARLGTDRFRKYNESRIVQAVAVVATFVYVSGTLFLFANDWTAMKNIFAVLKTP